MAYSLLEAIRELNKQSIVEKKEKKPADKPEEKKPEEPAEAPAEEEIDELIGLEEPSEDEEATMDEDIAFYRDVFAAWKEAWDEEHDEPFPELSEEELVQFVEMANNIADTPLEGEEELEEDFASSLPAERLPVSESRQFIENIPAPDPHRPPYFFKLGYMKELDKEIAASFRGGRGSEGNPFVRIVKVTEYSKLYTGSDWRKTDDTKHADKVVGTERHTGEKTGFNYGREGGVVNKIGVYPNGKEALQAYIADGSVQKVKFFISLDDDNLHEASREEVAQYLIPSWRNKVLAPSSQRQAAGVDAEGNEIFDKPINRFLLENIYMIGNLGHSIF